MTNNDNFWPHTQHASNGSSKRRCTRSTQFRQRLFFHLDQVVQPKTKHRSRSNQNQNQKHAKNLIVHLLSDAPDFPKSRNLVKKTRWQKHKETQKDPELLGLPTTVAALTRAWSGGATTWVPFYNSSWKSGMDFNGISSGFQIWILKCILTDFRHAKKKTSATTGLFLLQVMQSAMMLSVERRKLSQRFTFANLDFIFQQHAQHDPCRSERKMSKEKLLSNCSIKLC